MIFCGRKKKSFYLGCKQILLRCKCQGAVKAKIDRTKRWQMARLCYFQPKYIKVDARASGGRNWYELVMNSLNGRVMASLMYYWWIGMKPKLAFSPYLTVESRKWFQTQLYIFLPQIKVKFWRIQVNLRRIPKIY